MRLDNYLVSYFHVLMFIFFFINFWIFLIILIIWVPHFLNIESDTEYEFEFFSSDFYAVENKYLEYDIDDEFTYIMMNEEFYLIWNCKFYFDTYGGNFLLDFLDFVEIDLYHINSLKNFKYIYESLDIYNDNKKEQELNLESDYFLYYFNDDYFGDLNYSYLINNLNSCLYEFILNIHNLEKLKFKKRWYFFINNI